jgi:sRNA-binding protein
MSFSVVKTMVRGSEQNAAMLYKFHSAAAADVIMLEASAKRVLQAWGRFVDGPGKVTGIVTPEQLASAREQLVAAVAADDAARSAEQAAAKAEGRQAVLEAVSFRMRTQPLLEMLDRSSREQKPITWD